APSPEQAHPGHRPYELLRVLVARLEVGSDRHDVAIDEVPDGGEDLLLFARQFEQAHTAAASRRVNGDRAPRRSSSSSSAAVVSSRRSTASSLRTSAAFSRYFAPACAV